MSSWQTNALDYEQAIGRASESNDFAEEELFGDLARFTWKEEESHSDPLDLFSSMFSEGEAHPTSVTLPESTFANVPEPSPIALASVSEPVPPSTFPTELALPSLHQNVMINPDQFQLLVQGLAQLQQQQQLQHQATVLQQQQQAWHQANIMSNTNHSMLTPRMISPLPLDRRTVPATDSKMPQTLPIVTSLPVVSPSGFKTTTTTTPTHTTPLRALSAYNFFFLEERARLLDGTEPDFDYNPVRQQQLLDKHWKRDRSIKRRHRKSHGKISFAGLSKKISQRWKSLTEAQKDFYREVASKDWARYNQELSFQKFQGIPQANAPSYHSAIG